MGIHNLHSSSNSWHATFSVNDLSSLSQTSHSALYGVKKRRFITVVPSKLPSSGLSIRCFVHFRPCIDIHKGMVKQIVGSTLQDSKDGGSMLITNFESDKSAAEFANMYKEDGLKGGHVIMLGADSFSRSAAIKALNSYPGGLQVGGGITSENAFSYLSEGASHVIVTSVGKFQGHRQQDCCQTQRNLNEVGCRGWALSCGNVDVG